MTILFVEIMTLLKKTVNFLSSVLCSWRVVKMLSKKVIVYLVLLALFLFIYYCFTKNSASIKFEPKMNAEFITNKPKVTVYFGGRIGNHMFGYASLIGIAQSNNLIPVISESDLLWDVFKLPIHYGHVEATVVIRQKKVGTYEKIVENLEPKNTFLDGYWQSWKYFEKVREELLTKHFVFHDDVDLESDQFIRNALKEKHKTPDTTIVGVHIRRGDFVRQRLKGFSAAPVSYYYKAMNYFRKKYSNLLFIMVSNDVFWAEDHLDQGEDIYYSHNTPDKGPLDLAILSKCNHSVISSGSFSWWVGYLAGGEVVYYHLYPEKNTKIGNQTVKKDYYPPSWIPY